MNETVFRLLQRLPKSESVSNVLETGELRNLVFQDTDERSLVFPDTPCLLLGESSTEEVSLEDPTGRLTLSKGVSPPKSSVSTVDESSVLSTEGPKNVPERSTEDEKTVCALFGEEKTTSVSFDVEIEKRVRDTILFRL
jgi:hypothetical protein